MEEEPPPQTRVGAHVAPAVPDEKPRSGLGEGVLLLLFTVLTLAASAFVLISEESDAVSDPVQKAARGEITGLHELSLLRRPNLERVLAKVARGERTLVSSIRVSAARVDLTVRDRDGSRKILSADPGFGIQERDFGVGEDTAVQVTEIDAAAPERMTRAVARRSGQPAGAVEYVTMSFSGNGERSWYMALGAGPARVRQWVAAEDGGDLRKPGELSARQKAANAAQRRKYERERRRADVIFQRRSACLRRSRDAEAASACIERYAP